MANGHREGVSKDLFVFTVYWCVYNRFSIIMTQSDREMEKRNLCSHLCCLRRVLRKHSGDRKPYVDHKMSTVPACHASTLRPRSSHFHLPRRNNLQSVRRKHGFKPGSSLGNKHSYPITRTPCGDAERNSELVNISGPSIARYVLCREVGLCDPSDRCD